MYFKDEKFEQCSALYKKSLVVLAVVDMCHLLLKKGRHCVDFLKVIVLYLQYVMAK
jgi:hypothetical protein